MVDLAADLDVAIRAARMAGALAMSFFGKPLEVRQKSPNNPVSEADIAVDTFLKEALGAARPSYGWLSEETADDQSRLNARCVWVVDPIDGTRAFVAAKPHFTICIGLLVDAQVMLGVVYNPANDELYEAVIGQGARLNGEVIQAKPIHAIEGCKMLGDKAMFVHPAWPSKWPAMAIETRNSIAYRMCLVASGHFDAAIALSAKSDWDMVAAAIIVSEAGALATDHLGIAFAWDHDIPRQKSLVVASATLHPLLIERVNHVVLN